MAILPATTQTVATGPVPERSASAGGFAGALAAGLLGGRQSKIDRQRQLAADQRTVQSTLLQALINKGEIVPSDGGPNTFKFAGLNFSPAGSGIKIKSAQDLKALAEAGGEIAKNRFRDVTTLSKVVGDLSNAVSLGLADEKLSAEVIKKLMLELDDEIDNALDGDFSGLQGLVSQYGINMESVVPELESRRVARETGEPITKGGKKAPITPTEGSTLGDIGKLAATGVGGALIAGTPTKALGTALPVLARAAALKGGAATLGGAAAQGLGRLNPITGAALVGAGAGSIIEPFVRDPLTDAFAGMINRARALTGQIDPQVQQQLFAPNTLTPQQPQQIQQPFSQFGGAL
jgi:hypothetical protein